MNSDRIVGVLGPLAELFDEPVHFSRKGASGRWTHEVIAMDGGTLKQRRPRPARKPRR